jgi:hypothetical protein
MTDIEFIHIKPNSDKNINNGLLELLNKKLIEKISNVSSSWWNDTINDIYIDYNESFIECKSNDPVQFINNFFKSIDRSIDRSINVESIDKSIDFYDIISYDSDGEKLYLMLVDKNKNSVGYMEKKNEVDRKKDFNLLASTLSKYHSNSIAIFGDVFLIAINKEYYIKLENTSSKIDTQNSDKDYEELNKFLVIYYNFKFNHLINSFANVNFIKIYSVIESENIIKNSFIYSRDVLENIIKNPNIKSSIFDISKSIVKFSYENTNLFIKYTNPLPNSHYAIINEINKSEINISESNKYLYYINLFESDIIFLSNLTQIN